ncbi:MAG: ADP-glyceromanno-heptose 6-epimerase [Bdellovibrionaceae bacterium]|nr:ADP-glyceromanno-heptose 6-epimerase [Pseudobdellovibrionaceae bacterium]
MAMVIVTGANGFIGSVLVWELNSRGSSDVVCVDSVSLSERPELLRKRQFSRFLSKDELWSFLETPEARQQVTWILHMGACSSTTELDVEFLRENNTLYTQRLWEWCRDNRKNFVYASSGAVYGDGQEGFDDTTSPDVFKPLNPYGESKAAFDRWVVRERETPPHWYGLRFFNVFGPNEYHKGDMSSVVFKAFHQIREHGQLRLFRSHHPEYRDGEQMRDFVYVKDVTRWIYELMMQKPASGILNMGYGQARTWLDLARATFTNMDRDLKIDWIDIPVEMRPRYQYFTEAKMNRLFSLGISKPQWPLEKGIADYVRNHLAKSDPYL